jgi:hypothetical protein
MPAQTFTGKIKRALTMVMLCVIALCRKEIKISPKSCR